MMVNKQLEEDIFLSQQNNEDEDESDEFSESFILISKQ